MLGIVLERDGGVSLARQIRGHIADLILGSHIREGDALPSTRELARSLSVSRNTVTDAYEMLWAEGYIVGRRGSGFRVRADISLESRVHPACPARAAQPCGAPSVPMTIPYDFRTGIPDLHHFPFAAWNRIRRDILETIKPGDMLYGDTFGHMPLRAAIRDWLLRSRGMRVDCESIAVTSGATQATGLAVETFAGRAGAVLVENPGHPGITRLMRLRNIPFRLCGVDEQGMATDATCAETERISGVYVTPSHQFPLGCVLSAPRRARLVKAAREKDFYIIEDDYDSEFRYGGQTLAPLHSLDPDRVVYVGTFSKTLFPALRIGFAVVPAALRKSWAELRRYTDVQNAIADQAALARFLEQRKMDRHIKAMTKLYGRKRGMMIQAVADEFGDDARVLGDSAGLHFALRVRGQSFGREFRERCREKGVSVMPCSRYGLDEGANAEYRDTLLLGYGNIDESRIREGVRLLKNLGSDSHCRRNTGTP